MVTHIILYLLIIVYKKLIGSRFLNEKNFTW